MENIKTVFVDLDDTLWWFTENSKVSLRYVYDMFGLDKWCADYDRFVSIYLTKNNELWELYHYGKIEKDYLVTERFRYVLEQIGWDEGDKKELDAKLNAEYLDYLSKQKKTVPGAHELLEYLVARYDVNVLSNGFKGVQERKLKSGGLDGYINKLVLSDDCGITKPLRGIFDYALSECKAEASSTVMIGDNYDADICGAHNAGWRTIYFNKNGNMMSGNIADAEVNSLVDITKIL